MINTDKNNEALDLSYLREMSGDSAEFIIEMIDLFISQTPLYIEELQQAGAEGDWSKVAGVAHKIKPTFVYVGREDAKLHMQEMEENANARKELEHIPAAIREISEFVEVLYQKLAETRVELEKQL